MDRPRRIQESLRHHAATGRESTRSGPFTVYVADADASPGGSYAIPDAGARASAADADALRAAFAAHDVATRVELLVESAPGLVGDLIAAGFTVEDETPLLVCTPADLQAPPAPDGVTLQRVDEYSGEPALRALATVQQLACSGAEPTDADVARMPATLAGGLGVLARVGSEPAGGGRFGAPVGGVTELTGIAVAPDYRGAGIGGAITAELARLAFRAGAELAVVSPPCSDTGRVYEHAGFTPAYSVVHLRG